MCQRADARKQLSLSPLDSCTPGLSLSLLDSCSQTTSQLELDLRRRSMNPSRMSQVDKTKRVALRICQVDKSIGLVDPELVGHRITEAGVEFMDLVEWEVSEIADCLSVNWKFARTLKGHARAQRDQLFMKGICYECNVCGRKFAYREMLTRHVAALHDEGVRVVKAEPEGEEIIVEDRLEGLFVLVSSFSNDKSSQNLSARLRCRRAASWWRNPPAAAAAAAADDQLDARGCRQRPTRGPTWTWA